MIQTRTLVYQNGVAIDRLPDAVQARHLRIIVVDAADEHVKEELNVGLQVELYGCYIGPMDSDTECPTDNTFYSNLECTLVMEVLIVCAMIPLRF